MTTQLPPCGLYRTLRPIAGVPADRLVYFHNHGEPGPGLYLPTGWRHNRAEIDTRGHTLPEPEQVSDLEPLPPEGLYRVQQAFHCCDKQCRRFEAEALVQLGYNGAGEPILFVPELVDGQLALPERGTMIDPARFADLRQLKVPTTTRPATSDS